MAARLITFLTKSKPDDIPRNSRLSGKSNAVVIQYSGQLRLVFLFSTSVFLVNSVCCGRLVVHDLQRRECDHHFLTCCMMTLYPADQLLGRRLYITSGRHVNRLGQNMLPFLISADFMRYGNRSPAWNAPRQPIPSSGN